jgi:hypothetical protein
MSKNLNRNLDGLTEHSIDELKSQSTPDFSSADIELLAQMKAMQAELAAAKAAASTAKADAARAHRELVAKKLEEDSYDIVVGTSNNATDLPREGGLDIYVANSADHLHQQISAHGNRWERPIAWIPVVLYTALKQDAKKPWQSITTKEGTQIPNFKLGQTIVNQSYGSHTVTDPVTLDKLTVSLTGYASLSVAMNISTGDLQDPKQLADRLDKAHEKSQKLVRYNNGDPDSNPETPAFIGYEQSNKPGVRFTADQPDRVKEAAQS